MVCTSYIHLGVHTSLKDKLGYLTNKLFEKLMENGISLRFLPSVYLIKHWLQITVVS